MFYLVTPSGEIIEFEDINEFCFKNKTLNLTPRRLRDSVRGMYPCHKGYFCFNNIENAKKQSEIYKIQPYKRENTLIRF